MLEAAGFVIGVLITILLGVIAFNARRIYERVDKIERELHDSEQRVWEKLEGHEVRISLCEQRNGDLGDK